MASSMMLMAQIDHARAAKGIAQEVLQLQERGRLWHFAILEPGSDIRLAFGGEDDARVGLVKSILCQAHEGSVLLDK